MRYREFFLYSLTAIILITSSVSAQNILVNPDFETWDAGLPVSWTAESGVNITQTTDPVFSGVYAVELEATGSSNRGIYQLAPVVAGSLYEYSVYFFAPSESGTIGIYVNWLDIDGLVIGGEGTIYNTGFGVYELVTTGQVQAPAGAVSARCRIRCYANSAIGGTADAALLVYLGPGEATPTPTITPEPTATPTGPTPTPHPVDEIKINEVFINSPGNDVATYIELYYPGGIALDGYSLVGVNGNGGADYNTIDLMGQIIPADGFFVIAQDSNVPNYDMIDTNVNYQNGPDNIQLRYDTTVVDSIGYGNFTTAVFAGEGTPVPLINDTDSYSRIPDGVDTDNNVVDFVAGILTAGFENEEIGDPTPTPTQGEPTPTPTTGPTFTPPPIYDIKINEVHIDTPGSDTEAFVELYYDSIVSLDGYSLVGINGNDGQPYQIIDLTGYSIPADGFFVVAQADTVPNYDLLDSDVNYQNGPDSIKLMAGITVVDAIGYGDFTGAVFAGEGTPVAKFDDDVTYSRIPDGADTDNNEFDFIRGLITSGNMNEAAPVEPTPTPTITPTGGPCVNNGDTNLDGQLTAADAQQCFYIVLGHITPTYEQECAADCNGDGNVTAGDAQNIFLAVLGSGSCADPI